MLMVMSLQPSCRYTLWCQHSINVGEETTKKWSISAPGVKWIIIATLKHLNRIVLVFLECQKIQHKFEYPPGITAAWGYWSHGPFSSMIYLLDIFSQKPAPVPSPLVNHVPPILVNNRHTKNFHVPPILVNNRHSKNFHTYFHITPISWEDRRSRTSQADEALIPKDPLPSGPQACTKIPPAGEVGASIY